MLALEKINGLQNFRLRTLVTSTRTRASNRISASVIVTLSNIVFICMSTSFAALRVATRNAQYEQPLPAVGKHDVYTLARLRYVCVLLCIR